MLPILQHTCHVQLSHRQLHSAMVVKDHDLKGNLASSEFPNPTLPVKPYTWAAYTTPWSRNDCTAHAPGLPAWVGLDGALLS